MKTITNRILQTLSLCLVLLVVLGSTDLVYAQFEFEEEDYRKFSISVQGGTTFGNDDSGLRFLRSNLNTMTAQTYNFGGGAEYAITPFWSLGLGYRYINVEGEAGTFETDIHSIGLNSYFNFNRFYRSSSISDYLNPYLTLGVGRDFYTYESASQSVSKNEMHLRAGLGLALSLSNTFEVFGQYDQFAGSNNFDNIRIGFPADMIGTATGGIRIYFGGANQKPYSKAPPLISLTQAEVREYRQNSERIPGMEEQISEKDEEINRLQEQIAALENEHENELNELYVELNQKNEKLLQLESEVSDLQSELDEAELALETGLTQQLSAGHYVQFFAAFSENSAQSARQVAISMLNGVIDNPEQKVLITRRQQYYEVRIGVFDYYTNADQVLDILDDIFEDAFVVTFARPVNLEEIYKDIQVTNRLSADLQ